MGVLLRFGVYWCIGAVRLEWGGIRVQVAALVNINLVILLIDISNFVISGGILFKMLVLRINEMVSCLSSEVSKRLFLIFDLKDQYFC